MCWIVLKNCKYVFAAYIFCKMDMTRVGENQSQERQKQAYFIQHKYLIQV